MEKDKNQFTVEELDRPEIIEKIAEVVRLYRGTAPTIILGDCDEVMEAYRNGAIAVDFFKGWKEGDKPELRRVMVNLDEEIDLEFSEYQSRGKNPKITLRFCGFFRYKDTHERLMDTIEINISLSKEPNRIVKEINNRIFGKHSDQIIEYREKKQALINRVNGKMGDLETLQASNQFRWHTSEFGPKNVPLYHNDTGAAVRCEKHGIKIETGHSLKYFSAETPEQALAILDAIATFQACIDIITKKEKAA